MVGGDDSDDVIRKQIIDVSAAIHDMSSEYEQVRDIYNTNINKEWTENAQAKDVVRNMVALYRLLQDQNKNLLGARNELKYLSRRIGFAAEDEDFEAIFTAADGEAPTPPEDEPFRQSQTDYVKDTADKIVSNKHDVANAPHVMSPPETVSAHPIMVLVRAKENWATLTPEQREQFDRLQLLLLRRNKLPPLLGGGPEPWKREAEWINTPRNDAEKEENRQFIARYKRNHPNWNKEKAKNGENKGRGDNNSGYRNLADLAREMGNFKYEIVAFKSNLLKMYADIQMWLQINDADFARAKSHPELSKNHAFQEFYNRLNIAKDRMQHLNAYFDSIQDEGRVDVNTWEYFRGVVFQYTYIRDHAPTYVDETGHFKPVQHALKDPHGVKLVPVIATPLPGADPEKGMYSRLLDMYRNAKPDQRRKAAERIIDIVDSTPFLNQHAIEITIIDRIIFFVLTMAIRAAALRGVSMLVHRNVVRTLRGAIVVYGMFYTLLVTLLFGAVTLDDAVLRIAFNYLNSHSNTSRVVLHVAVLWLLLLVSFTVLTAEQGPLQSTTPVSLSTADQDDITQNLIAISFFVWIVTSAQVGFM